MPRPFDDKYTFNHKALGDGSVTFQCSKDAEVWPWLRLHPIHPILVQTINFWASIDSGEFLGEFNPDTWTALTQVSWTCGSGGLGLPAHGVYRNTQDENRARYELAFFDHADRLVVRLKGQGVTFRTRNFEGWRKEAKEKLKPSTAPDFHYAPKEAVGVTEQRQSFLAPLSDGDIVSTTGLITKENGLRPNHAFIGGSGDHVNSTHMGEVGRQFGQLLLGRPLINTGGEMTFDHYVELGNPFEVELKEYDRGQRSFAVTVRQAGRECTRIKLSYAFAP